jgi:8-oxo-dGTP pyrophosphatase MutT (NUDIX family)
MADRTVGRDFDPYAVPVRAAATVMLVRDGERGMEVFMLRRTSAAVFAAGMYVFPGGRLDDADASPETSARCEGRSDIAASQVLMVPHGGLAYWVAAIRETFEEAGVLLAGAPGDSGFVAFDDADVAARFVEHRREVHAGRRSLADVCTAEDLTLRTAGIGYMSRWVTPVGEARRFDTRFFVARAPQGQDPLHDNSETVDSLWVRPADALDRFHSGALGMFPPTVANLEALAAYADADAAVAAALATESTEPRPPIQPKLRVDGDGRVVELLLPWHAGYDEAPDYAVVD